MFLIFLGFICGMVNYHTNADIVIIQILSVSGDCLLPEKRHDSCVPNGRSGKNIASPGSASCIPTQLGLELSASKNIAKPGASRSVRYFTLLLRDLDSNQEPSPYTFPYVSKRRGLYHCPNPRKWMVGTSVSSLYGAPSLHKTSKGSHGIRVPLRG
jgi:hypothetical protein